MQNLVYEWVDFSKVPQIWAKIMKIGSNLRKFWKNRVILLKIWQKMGPIGIWMGRFFLKNWYLYGSTFKFCGGTSLPKPNLSTPPGCSIDYCVRLSSTRMYVKIAFISHWNDFCLIPLGKCASWRATNRCKKFNFEILVSPLYMKSENIPLTLHIDCQNLMSRDVTDWYNTVDLIILILTIFWVYCQTACTPPW